MGGDMMGDTVFACRKCGTTYAEITRIHTARRALVKTAIVAGLTDTDHDNRYLSYHDRAEQFVDNVIKAAYEPIV